MSGSDIEILRRWSASGNSDAIAELDTGGWVLFMDGHTEWREYPGEFPMTEAFIGRIREVQGQSEGCN